MTILKNPDFDGARLKEVIKKFGRNFLGEDAAISDVEELEAGVSYNYKLRSGGLDYILKVDNPQNNNARKLFANDSNDTRSDAERFNDIAEFVNAKIADHYLHAPEFVAARSGGFCLVNDSDDADLPKEFHGRVVSLQKFLTVEQAPANKRDPYSQQELKSLAENLGRLHRPMVAAQQFPTPKKAPSETIYDNVRAKVEEHFGFTKEERAEKITAMANLLQQRVTQMLNDGKVLEAKAIMQFFPEDTINADFLQQVVEDYCNKPKRATDLSETMQLSHRDFHRGNMVRGDDRVALIDFDELGRANPISDMWMLLEADLDIFNSAGDKTKTARIDILNDFLVEYLAFNPYLTRQELKGFADYTQDARRGVMMRKICELDDFVKGEKTTQKGVETITEDDVEAMSRGLRDTKWMTRFETEEGKVRDEAHRKMLGEAYDAVFAGLVKARPNVDAQLLADVPPFKGRGELDHLDLATDKPKSWVEKVEVARRAAENSKDSKTKL